MAQLSAICKTQPNDRVKAAIGDKLEVTFYNRLQALDDAANEVMS